VRDATDGSHVVLAHRAQRDVSQQDDIVVTGRVEIALEQRLRIDRVAAEPLLVGADHARGRVEQALASRRIARPADQRAHGGFGLLAGRACLVLRRDGGLALDEVEAGVEHGDSFGMSPK